jgi:hypothetical protein
MTDESVLEKKNMNFQEFNCFQNISTLKFYDCPLLSNFPTVGGCENSSFLPFLPALGYLEIYFCAELESLDILGGPDLKYPLHELNLHNCRSLRNISFQRKVFSVSNQLVRRTQNVGRFRTD